MNYTITNVIIEMTKVTLKLFILIVLSLQMSVAEDTSAQVKSVKEVKVSIHQKNTTLRNLFKEIENKTGYTFNFSSRKINLSKKITINRQNGTLEEVLLDISKNHSLSFKQVNNSIGVYQKAEAMHQDRIPVEVSLDIDLKGKITDENGEGLPGASVVVKGTAIGTTTDIEGSYAISVPEDATLVVSFVGYKTQEVTVSGRSVIDLQMTLDAEQLEEVVVVGYGTQAKKDVTGSIVSISSEAIEQRPIASIDDALQGLGAGLNLSTRTAAPGALARITIRGIGSISAGYEPLWVIDGFPTDQRNAQSLNPADIKSVEILKDASSTAIYGSRGANGVIIITTKDGRKERSSFNVSTNSGVSTVPKSQRMKLLNAEEYVQFHTEMNGGVVPDFIANYWDGVTDTDWQEELFRTAPFQNYSVSGSGGSEKASYLLSANYTNQEGTIPNEGFEKYSARLKMEYRPNDKVILGLNLAPNYSTINSASNRSSNANTIFSGAYQQAIRMAPIIPVRRSDGSLAYGGDLPGFEFTGNPLETVQLYSETQDIFRFLGGLSLAVEPIDNLIIKSTVSANFGYDGLQMINNPAPDGLSRAGYSNLNTLSIQKQMRRGWLNENTITYKRVFGDHAFDVLAGFTAQKEEFESLSSSVVDLQVQGPTILSLGNASTLTSSNGLSSNSLTSYLARANYSFKDRYLITGTIRNDGSSRFGANNRRQTFGSFALGWRLSEESFIKKLGFVDNAKLRGSFGTTGSNLIGDFVARSSLSPINHSFGNETVTGVSIASPGNSFLTWETSEQLDLGLDLTLFNGRFDLVFDYYNNETTSLLLSRNLVPSSGFSGYLTNIGSMRNKGVELSVNIDVVDNEDFSMSVGGNVTHNDQEILDLGGDDEIRNYFGALRRTVGGELQNIHVTRAIGILREGQTLTTGEAVAQGTPQAGDIIYEDVNQDGSVSNFLGPDGQILDGTNIDWAYGFNTKMRYKNFELTTLFTGQAGGSVLDLQLTQQMAPGRAININFSKEYWYDGRYISESQSGDGRTPKAGRYNDGVSSVSSLAIQDTDYLRFKNITLSYYVTQKLLDRIGLKSARIYTSVENVATWTKFIGGNPDARTNSGGGPSLFGGSRLPGVSDGLELGLTSGTDQPLPRIWTVGLNFSF